MTPTLKIEEFPQIGLKSLFIVENNIKRSIHYNLSKLTPTHRSMLENGGLIIGSHFVSLLKKLKFDNHYTQEVMDMILSIAILSNDISTLDVAENVISISKMQYLIGDSFIIAGQTSTYVLVDIDINDENFILVEISNLVATRLVKAKSTSLTRK